MKTIVVIFGNITFNHFTDEELKLFKGNTEHKALVHEVALKMRLPKDKAEIIADDMVNIYTSYVIPDVFKGEIVYEQKSIV